MPVKKKIPAILLVIAALVQLSVGLVVQAAGYSNHAYMPIGAKKNSAAANVFYVDNKGFVLLDNVKGENGGYYCLALDSYGGAKFDDNNTTKMDLEDNNNIAYILNHVLTGEQQLAGISTLPETILKNIDVEHVWDCDKGRGFDEYTITCGVGLLSMGEYFQYVDKLGLEDNLTIGWWTRSPSVDYATHVLWLGTGTTVMGGSVSWDAWGVRQIRPSFWLSEDFFKNAKISTKYMGSNIKKEILKFSDDGTLRTLGYTDKDLEEIHNIDNDIETAFNLSMPSYTGKWYGINQFDFVLSVDLVYKESKTYHVKGYLDEQLMIDDHFFVPKNTTKNVTYNTGEMGNGDHSLVLKIYEGDELAYTITKKFSVMKLYERQFMDEYSGKGFNHHLRLISSYAAEIDAMTRIGSMALRDGAQWNGVEKIKKQYDYSTTDPWLREGLKMPGTFLWVFAFNNDLYSGLAGVGDSVKYAATKKEVYDNYAEHANDLLNRYPQIDYAMLWNEPSGAGFWKPGVDIPSYAYLVTTAGAYIKENVEKNNYKTGIVGGSSAINYAKKTAEVGGYPFVDFWTATYYSTNPAVEYSARRVAEEYVKRGFGGWKGLIAYEFGYPTSVGRFTPKEEAENLIVQYVLQDSLRYKMQTVYQFNDFGYSTTDREQNYGVIKYGGEAKPALYSVATFFSRINGAKYIGKVQDNDFEINFYYKDGNPIGVIWSKDGTKEFKIENADYSAYNLNDNKIDVQNGSIWVDGSPIYITGLSKEWLLKSIQDSVQDEAELMLDYYAHLLGSEPEFDSRIKRFEAINSDGVVRLNEDLYNELIGVTEEDAYGYPIIREKVMTQLEAFNQLTQNGLPESGAMESFIRDYYQMGTELMTLYKNGDIHMSLREFSGLTFSLHWIGEYFANLYMITVGESGVVPATQKQRFMALKSAMKREESKHVGGLYEYGEAMLTYAMRYAEEAEDVAGKKEANPQKAGVIASRELMASVLYDWINEFKSVEGISTKKVFLQMTRANRKLYNFAENTAVFSLYNFGAVNFDGVIKFYDSEEKELFTAPAKVAANSTVEVKQDFNLKNTTENRRLYTVRLYSGDRLFYEEKIDDMTLAETASIAMNTTTESFDSLSSISFDVKNTFNSPIDVTVKVTPPEGWRLAKNEESITVKPGTTRKVSFAVTDKRRTDFNEYYFDVDLIEEGEVIAAFKDTPLQFTYIPRAQSTIYPETFTGDISAWKNAYPVMVNVPENPADENSWKNANAALRAYAQWDANYLYVLVRVNDDLHLNTQKPGNDIWNGDNIQISIDADHTRTTSYDDGDYEYGFSLLDSGQANHAWKGDNAAFSNMSFKIVRNDNEKTTNYLLKFPKAAVSPLQLTAGSQFGMNFVLNECDYIVRDYYYELTEGTARSKSPVYYHTWVLGK